MRAVASVHTVVQGECLSSIAKKYGFAKWRTIYDHPQNAEFKKTRPNPNVIHPGDRIVIPDKQSKHVSVATQKTHTFRVKTPKTWLRIVLKDTEGRPVAGKKYTLEFAGSTREGISGNDGLVEEEIPADAEAGTLTVTFDETADTRFKCSLGIGHLDPVETTTGVQARLNNLGFFCGAIDGIAGPKTEMAIRAFQKKHGLSADGIAGGETQGKIKQVHGS